jgi:predicted kinase
MENPKVAIIFMGIPASGKSTYYQTYFKDDYTCLSLDALHTRHEEKLLLEQCIKEGKSFVIDNTNPEILDRERYIVPALPAGYRVVGYFFQSILSECLRRNHSRSGKARVPDVALYSISSRLEMPSKEEGFDALYFVRIVDNSFITEPWKEES